MPKCSNCGNNFQGNFCPNFGQEANPTTDNATLQTLINTPKSQTNSAYDDILENGFEEAWRKNNPKTKLILTVSYWSGWVLLALALISLLIAVIEIFTLTDDITSFTPENYDSVCLWAKLAVSFGVITLIRRNASNITEYCSYVKWAKFLQNNLARNPLKEEVGKSKIEEKDFAVLTDKKFYTIQLALLIGLLLVSFAISIYLFVNINEWVRIIIAVKLSIQLNIPMSSTVLDVLNSQIPTIIILGVIQIALEIILKLVNKYFIKKLG